MLYRCSNAAAVSEAISVKPRVAWDMKPGARVSLPGFACGLTQVGFLVVGLSTASEQICATNERSALTAANSLQRELEYPPWQEPVGSDRRISRLTMPAISAIRFGAACLVSPLATTSSFRIPGTTEAVT